MGDSTSMAFKDLNNPNDCKSVGQAPAQRQRQLFAESIVLLINQNDDGQQRSNHSESVDADSSMLEDRLEVAKVQRELHFSQVWDISEGVDEGTELQPINKLKFIGIKDSSSLVNKGKLQGEFQE